MDRSNHYEAALEAYLRAERLCYIAVDESRRTLLADSSVKSIDFVVYGAGGAKLLIDVKGRRYPGGSPARPRYVWENWSTRADLDGLDQWCQRFGSDYRGVLLFSYQLGETVRLPEQTPDLWEHRGRRYLLRAIAADDYRREMRVRSPKWDTVHLPRAAYRDLVVPFRRLTQVQPRLAAVASEAST